MPPSTEGFAARLLCHLTCSPHPLLLLPLPHHAHTHDLIPTPPCPPPARCPPGVSVGVMPPPQTSCTGASSQQPSSPPLAGTTQTAASQAVQPSTWTDDQPYSTQEVRGQRPTQPLATHATQQTCAAHHGRRQHHHLLHTVLPLPVQSCSPLCVGDYALRTCKQQSGRDEQSSK